MSHGEPPKQINMIGKNFNQGWTVYNANDDTKKTVVNLPHDAMLTETRRPKLKNGSATGYFPGGKYIYTKLHRSCNTTETLRGIWRKGHPAVRIGVEAVDMVHKKFLQ